MPETLAVILLLFLTLGLGFFVRMPYWGFPLDEDAGFYTYLPHFEHRGVRFLRDFWGIFPPTLLFMVRWVLRTFRTEIRSVRIFSTLVHLCTVFSVFWLTRRLFGTEAALASAFLYSLYASVPFLAWFSIHSENYYLLPVTWGLYFCTLGVGSHSALFCALSGAFFAAGFLIKIVVAAYAVFLGAYLWAVEGGNAAWFLSGFAVPVLLYIAVLTFFFRGQNRELLLHMRLRMAGFRNFSGGKWLSGEWKKDVRTLFLETAPVWMGVFLWLFDPSSALLRVYALGTLAIFLVQKAYSPYHYLPLIHLLCIQTGGVFKGLADPSYGLALYGAIAFILLHGVKTARRCFLLSHEYSAFEKSDQYLYLPSVGRDLQGKIPEDERLYVWGSYNQVYQLCDRLATDQYFFFLAGPYRDPYLSRFYDAIVGGIIRYRPRYLLETHHTLNMEALSRFTGLAYVVERVYFNKFRLWRLEGPLKGLPSPPLSWREKNAGLEALSSGKTICGLDDFYYREGRLKEGEAECREALKLDPDDPENLHYLGVLLREAKREGEALECFDRLLSGSRGKRMRVEARLERAVTLREMGRLEEAVAAFNEAEPLVFAAGKTERRRLRASLFLNRGIARRLLGNVEGALREFRKAEGFDPPGVHLQLGILFHETGRPEQAWKELEKEAERFPKNPDVFLYMGILRTRKGEYRQGLSCFDKALSVNPSLKMRSFLLYQRGSVLERMGKWPGARDSFLESLAHPCLSGKVRSGAHFHLGSISNALHKPARASEHFKKCLELCPDHTAARRALGLDNRSRFTVTG